MGNNELYHHGILGQKWGKRNGPPYPLDADDHSAREKKYKKYRNVDGSLNRKAVKKFKKRGENLRNKADIATQENRLKVIDTFDKMTKATKQEYDRLYEKNYSHNEKTDWVKKKNANLKELKRMDELDKLIKNRTNDFLRAYDEALLKDINYKDIKKGMLYLEAYRDAWKLRNPSHFYENKSRNH